MTQVITLVDEQSFIEKNTILLNTFCDIRYFIQNNTLNPFLLSSADILTKKFLLHGFSINNLFINKTEFDDEVFKEYGGHDALSIWTLLRSQFESYAVFNHIFINPKTEEDIHIRCALWVISGLKYRNRHIPKTKEAEDKKLASIETINDYETKIQNQPSFKSLDEDNKNKFLRFMKDKEWQFFIEEHKIKKIAGFSEMILRAGFSKRIFEQFYNQLSLYSHPTYVAIHQLNSEGWEDFVPTLSKFGVECSTRFISAMIIDYCKIFPQATKFFNKLPKEVKYLIEFENHVVRGIPD
ncbi:MAG: hypothetical protein AABZ74_05500 [Cyanobacteriota bacterium]